MGEDTCRHLQSQMKEFIETRKYVGSSSWRLLCIFRMWFSRHGGVRLTVGLDDVRGLFQP